MNAEESHNEQNNPQNQETIPSDGGVGSEPRGKTENPSDGGNKSEEHQTYKYKSHAFIWKKRLSSPIFHTISTAVLGFANIVLVVYVIRQTDIASDMANSSREQSTEMQKQSIMMRESIDASNNQIKETLEIARRQAEIAENSLRAAQLQSGAFISYQGTEHDMMLANNEFKVIVVLFNSGNTPAFKFAVKTNLSPVSPEYLHRFMATDDTTQIPDTDVIIGAHKEHRTGRGIFISQEEFDAIQSDKLFLTARILFAYVDIWGEGHRKEFKFTYAPHPSMGPPQFTSYVPPRTRK